MAPTDTGASVAQPAERTGDPSPARTRTLAADPAAPPLIADEPEAHQADVLWPAGQAAVPSSPAVVGDLLADEVEPAAAAMAAEQPVPLPAPAQAAVPVTTPDMRAAPPPAPARPPAGRTEVHIGEVEVVLREPPAPQPRRAPRARAPVSASRRLLRRL
ncbi:MAG: hypothetical protein AAFP23_03045 [Pseudomonadota bacterium]